MSNGLSGTSRDEWIAWQTLCGRLRALDAITEDDLRASAYSRRTPGQCLLGELRAWGDLRAQQGSRGE